MYFISHRGNLDGPNKELENSPAYIEKAISLGFDCEIDIWCVADRLWLGHDRAEQEIEYNFLYPKMDKLWIHCKNIEAMLFFIDKNKSGSSFNFFWHENDKYTLTSLGYVWAYPSRVVYENAINVLPEIKRPGEIQYLSNERAKLGFCSDYIKEIRDAFN